MSAVILTIGFIIWLVAAYAAVRAVMAVLAVTGAAPQGKKMKALLALGSLNFPEANQIVGETASQAVVNFRSAAKLFAFSLIPFFGLVLLNILSGNAA